MSIVSIERPAAGEHAEYYDRYISKVPKGDLVTLLKQQIGETVGLLRPVSADRANYAYEPGKWTVKEVVGHMTDVERVMSYRALSIARNDKTNLPGFDENAWVANAAFADRTLGDLLEEFQAVRAATIQLARHLNAAELTRLGSANGHPVSVRALLYIIAGHEVHHTMLFRERYLLQS